MVEDNLARFRADPAKIRVSIRRSRGTWVVCVWSYQRAAGAIAEEPDPKKATLSALKRAETRGFDGIDLGMGRAYPHPQKGEFRAS